MLKNEGKVSQPKDTVVTILAHLFLGDSVYFLLWEHDLYVILYFIFSIILCHKWFINILMVVQCATAWLCHQLLLLMLNFSGGFEFFTINNRIVNTSEWICVNSKLYPWALFLKVASSPTYIFVSIAKVLNGPWLDEAAFQDKHVLKGSVSTKMLEVIFGVA